MPAEIHMTARGADVFRSENARPDPRPGENHRGPPGGHCDHGAYAEGLYRVLATWCARVSVWHCVFRFLLMSHVAVRVPVRLGSRRERCAVWRLAGEQRQAFNRGVGLCLESAGDGARLPSKFDLHKHLTADRSSGRMPSEVPVKTTLCGSQSFVHSPKSRGIWLAASGQSEINESRAA